MFLEFTSLQDFARAFTEARVCQATTTKDMAKVETIFTARASDMHGSYIACFRVRLFTGPESFINMHVNTINSKHDALLNEAKKLGLELSDGIWKKEIDHA